MQLTDAETELLKAWLIKRLEDISDADSDVLADYVLALVKTDEPTDVVRSNCAENLRDFLQDSTEKFVDEVLNSIETKAYDPTRPALQPQVPAFQPQQPAESRKRGSDWVADNGANDQGPSFSGADRPMKQARRGGMRGFDQRRGRVAQQHNQPWQPQHMPQVPMPPLGMPNFDPQNPMATLLAMQQAMGMPPMPGMPQFPSPGPIQGGNGFSLQKNGQRCRDYDTKGFCARGASCHFEHGNEALVVGQNEEYDPSNSSIMPPLGRTGSMQNGQYERGRGGMRGRGRGHGPGRGGSRRADYSHVGQNYDQSVTAVVVEQIPEDKFDEDSVRDFFAQFGNVTNIDMQPYKRLAVITYNSYDSAKAAYDSPKVIFDNRFVKVYWYIPDAEKHTNGHGQFGGSKATGDVEMKEEEIDPAEVARQQEEIARRQEEAQRKHEEAKKKREEAEKAKFDIDAKLRAMDAERKKMAELLAKKAAKSNATPAESPSNGNGPEETEQTKALKAQLAKLEAEAKDLGLDTEIAANGWGGAGFRGRGGYRGRGTFVPRGRGGWNPRGGWAGNGGAVPGGAVKRLDNRPKNVSLVLPGEFDKYDEALRQYLLLTNQLDHATLTRHPDRPDAAVVAFQERYRAENFLVKAKNATEIPHIGPVEVSWIAGQSVPAPNGTEAAEQGHDIDVKMEFDEPVSTGNGEAAYDVAEDDGWN